MRSRESISFLCHIFEIVFLMKLCDPKSSEFLSVSLSVFYLLCMNPLSVQRKINNNRQFNFGIVNAHPMEMLPFIGPISGTAVTLKTGRREVPGAIPGRACRPSRSEFSVVFSETRVNTG